MKTSYFKLLDKRQFSYGSKIVLLTVHIETTRPTLIPRKSNIYTHNIEKNLNYYRVVTVYAFEDKEEIPDNIEGVSMNQKQSASDVTYDRSNVSSIRSSTFCRIRKEPVKESTGILKYGPSYWIQRSLGEKEPHLQYFSEGPHVDLLTQLEDTLQSVLEEIDRQDNLSSSSVDIAVDVAVDDLEETARSSSEKIAEEVVGEDREEYDAIPKS